MFIPKKTVRKIAKQTSLACGLTLSLISANIASANDFTVQIGAYKYLSQDIVNDAEAYGQVFQSKSRNQLTRIQVGAFQSRSQAASLLRQLRSAGYRDAYITLLDYDIASNLPNNTDYGVAASTQVKTAAPIEITFDSLTEDEKSKATYLDGKLQIFENGQFLSVSQYRLSKR